MPSPVPHTADKDVTGPPKAFRRNLNRPTGAKKKRWERKNTGNLDFASAVRVMGKSLESHAWE